MMKKLMIARPGPVFCPGRFKPSSRLETVAQHADKKEGNSEHPVIMF